NVCNIPEPATGLEAKFSLHQTVAMALAGLDTSSLASYSVAAIRTPQIAALRGKVSVDFRTNWSASVAEMTVQMEDGTILEARHDSGIPSSDLTKQRRALESKFIGLLTPVLGQAMTYDLLSLIRQIANLDDIGNLARAAMAP
ncbi:MAG TPA: hypothetical protein PJ982_18575, partial [Lacipirellulaceae bacterium]|nr:hypothetical protein [Lacipirellulaceae bacterium]